MTSWCGGGKGIILMMLGSAYGALHSELIQKPLKITRSFHHEVLPVERIEERPSWLKEKASTCIMWDTNSSFSFIFPEELKDHESLWQEIILGIWGIMTEVPWGRKPLVSADDTLGLPFVKIPMILTFLPRTQWFQCLGKKMSVYGRKQRIKRLRQIKVGSEAGL